MIRTTIARCVLGSALGFMALAAQADVIDQTSPVGNAGYNGNASSLAWQQQVVTGMAGQLTSIDLFTTGTGGAPLQAFRVSINKGSGWQSDADDFSAIVMPGEGMTSINVSSANLNFAVGEAFVIGVAGLGPNGGCCTIQGSALPGGYGPGDLFLDGSLYNGGDYDFAFNTHVGSVPEPATLALMGAGLLAVGLATRRRSSGE